MTEYSTEGMFERMNADSEFWMDLTSYLGITLGEAKHLEEMVYDFVEALPDYENMDEIDENSIIFNVEDFEDDIDFSDLSIEKWVLEAILANSDTFALSVGELKSAIDQAISYELFNSVKEAVRNFVIREIDLDPINNLVEFV